MTLPSALLSSPDWNHAGATLVAFACNGPELLTNSCSIYLNDESVGLSEQMTKDTFRHVAHSSLLVIRKDGMDGLCACAFAS